MDLNVEELLEAPFKKVETSNQQENQEHIELKNKPIQEVTPSGSVEPNPDLEPKKRHYSPSHSHEVSGRSRSHSKRHHSRDRRSRGKSSRSRRRSRSRHESRRERSRPRYRSRTRYRNREGSRPRDRSRRDRSRERDRSGRRSRDRVRSERRSNDRRRSRSRDKPYSSRNSRDRHSSRSRMSYKPIDLDDSDGEFRASPGPELTPFERDARTVFVMQLHPKLTTKKLARFFQVAGKVRSCRLIYDKVTNRPKGVGYVEFAYEEAIEPALKLSGQLLMGFPILVEYTEPAKNYTIQAQPQTIAPPKKHITPSNRIWVSNLHENLCDRDIQDLFQPFGDIESVNVNRDKETRKSKGSCFVTYRKTPNAKVAAEKMNGFSVAGKSLQVVLITDANKSNFEPRKLVMPGLDDETKLVSHSRVELMAKLARNDDPYSSVAASLEGKFRCLLLKNAFNPEEETLPDWDKEIEEDIKMECDKIGKVLHIAVDKLSMGYVYIKFESSDAAEKAKNMLDGRFFAGRKLACGFMEESMYSARFSC